MKLPNLGNNRSTHIEFEFYGHQTYIFELARIFDIHPMTLRNRLKNGWDINAALYSKPGDGYNVRTQGELGNKPEVIRFVRQVLDTYYKAKQQALAKQGANNAKV